METKLPLDESVTLIGAKWVQTDRENYTEFWQQIKKKPQKPKINQFSHLSKLTPTRLGWNIRDNHNMFGNDFGSGS